MSVIRLSRELSRPPRKRRSRSKVVKPSLPRIFVAILFFYVLWKGEPLDVITSMFGLPFP